MLDAIAVALMVIVPTMVWSVYLVKFRRRFQLHKRIQLALGAVLLVAIGAFEADMRLSGWTQRAVASPHWSDAGWNDWVHYSLAVHLFFAVPTAILWAVVIVQALRRFPVPPVPNQYSPRHIIWARLAAAEMILTAASGWWFYWLAFVAE
jgi:hypothetical protein